VETEMKRIAIFAALAAAAAAQTPGVRTIMDRVGRYRAGSPADAPPIPDTAGPRPSSTLKFAFRI